MAQQSPSKVLLLHPIENHRNTNKKTKNSTLNTTENTGTNTETLRFNHDISTNTPNYAEQMAKALENGTSGEDIVQMLMQSKE